MPEIAVKLGNTGEDVPITDIDIDKVTGEDLIYQLVTYGILRPESELPPKNFDGTHGYYGIVNM